MVFIIAEKERAPQCLGHHLALPSLLSLLAYLEHTNVLLDYWCPFNEYSLQSLLQSARDFNGLLLGPVLQWPEFWPNPANLAEEDESAFPRRLQGLPLLYVKGGNAPCDVHVLKSQTPVDPRLSLLFWSLNSGQSYPHHHAQKSVCASIPIPVPSSLIPDFVVGSSPLQLFPHISSLSLTFANQ